MTIEGSEGPKAAAAVAVPEPARVSDRADLPDQADLQVPDQEDLADQADRPDRAEPVDRAGPADRADLQEPARPGGLVAALPVRMAKPRGRGIEKNFDGIGSKEETAKTRGLK